jgi:hypothetical protein
MTLHKDARTRSRLLPPRRRRTTTLLSFIATIILVALLSNAGGARAQCEDAQTKQALRLCCYSQALSAEPQLPPSIPQDRAALTTVGASPVRRCRRVEVCKAATANLPQTTIPLVSMEWVDDKSPPTTMIIDSIGENEGYPVEFTLPGLTALDIHRNIVLLSTIHACSTKVEKCTPDVAVTPELITVSQSGRGVNSKINSFAVKVKLPIGEWRLLRHIRFRTQVPVTSASLNETAYGQADANCVNEDANYIGR